MSNWELLQAGVKLMAFGMGLVFVFLVLMILCMRVMQKVVKPFDHLFAPPPAPPARKPAGPAAAPAAGQIGIVAAAVAAVADYRRNN